MLGYSTEMELRSVNLLDVVYCNAEEQSRFVEIMLKKANFTTLNAPGGVKTNA